MSSRQDRAIQPAQSREGKPYLDRADFVIIGNGIAGLTAAVEARRLAPDKRIVMITEQIHPTINTPALKQFAVGKLTREQLLAYPAGTERTERIHVVTARVEEIHAQSKYVTLTGNRGFGYDTLLIATGSAPTGLPASTPGYNFDGVLTLHRLQDYLDFRRRISEVSDAVVIGGGVHAIETVMNLLHWGIHVHWLIRSATFMPRVLDDVASQMVLDRVRRAGVSVYTETEVVGVVGRIGIVAGVITNRQEMLPCQMVLTCTGTQPVTTLAEHCSLPMQHKRGIMVDDTLRTSVRDIYAAGDVAALKNPQTGKYEPRALWFAAVSQGRIAGAMMAGRKELAQQPFGAPWQATHLGELFMLSVGDPISQSSKITTLTDMGQGGYRRMTLADDRLVGYLSLGTAQPDSLAIKRIIDEGHSVRDIKKALLKGNFDARRYLSQLRSRVAENMLASGSMPVVRSLDPIPRPVTGGLEQLAAVRQTGGLSPVARREDEQFTAWPEPTLQAEASGDNKRAVLFEGEISAFTGTLPSISNDVIEEISPFTGNLPLLPSKAVESTLVPISSSEEQPSRSRGFWSYAEESSSKNVNGNAARSSRSLWSYRNKENVARGDKRS